MTGKRNCPCAIGVWQMRAIPQGLQRSWIFKCGALTHRNYDMRELLERGRSVFINRLSSKLNHNIALCSYISVRLFVMLTNITLIRSNNYCASSKTQ